MALIYRVEGGGDSVSKGFYFVLSVVPGVASKGDDTMQSTGRMRLILSRV